MSEVGGGSPSECSTAYRIIAVAQVGRTGDGGAEISPSVSRDAVEGKKTGDVHIG